MKPTESAGPMVPSGRGAIPLSRESNKVAPLSLLARILTSGTSARIDVPRFIAVDFLEPDGPTKHVIIWPG